jgi:hypothetical protein
VKNGREVSLYSLPGSAARSNDRSKFPASSASRRSRASMTRRPDGISLESLCLERARWCHFVDGTVSVWVRR